MEICSLFLIASQSQGIFFLYFNAKNFLPVLRILEKTRRDPNSYKKFYLEKLNDVVKNYEEIQQRISKTIQK